MKKEHELIVLPTVIMEYFYKNSWIITVLNNMENIISIILIFVHLMIGLLHADQIDRYDSNSIDV